MTFCNATYNIYRNIFQFLYRLVTAFCSIHHLYRILTFKKKQKQISVNKFYNIISRTYNISYWISFFNRFWFFSKKIVRHISTIFFYFSFIIPSFVTKRSKSSGCFEPPGPATTKGNCRSLMESFAQVRTQTQPAEFLDYQKLSWFVYKSSRDSGVPSLPMPRVFFGAPCLSSLSELSKF